MQRACPSQVPRQALSSRRHVGKAMASAALIDGTHADELSCGAARVSRNTKSNNLHLGKGLTALCQVVVTGQLGRLGRPRQLQLQGFEASLAVLFLASFVFGDEVLWLWRNAGRAGLTFATAGGQHDEGGEQKCCR
jgi:hypothetical protein